MSERELSRLKIIEDVEAQRLSVVQAADLAGISRRQMTRLIKSYRTKGASGLVSKKRGAIKTGSKTQWQCTAKNRTNRPYV